MSKWCAALSVYRWLWPVLVSLTLTLMFYHHPASLFFFSSRNLRNGEKKKTPISGERYSRVLSGRNLALALHAAQGGCGRRDMPIIMQHIPCPANSRLQTKRALSSCLLSKWGRAALESAASRVSKTSGEAASSRARHGTTPPAERAQAATKETPLLCRRGHTFSPIVSLALVAFCCQRF